MFKGEIGQNKEVIQQEVPLLDQLIEDCVARFKSRKTTFFEGDPGQKKRGPYTIVDAAVESITTCYRSPFEILSALVLNPEGSDLYDAVGDSGGREPEESWTDYVVKVSSLMLADEIRFRYQELYEEEGKRIDRWDRGSL